MSIHTNTRLTEHGVHVEFRNTHSKTTTGFMLDGETANKVGTELAEASLNMRGHETVSVRPVDVEIGDIVPGFGKVYVMPYSLGEEVTLYLDTHARLVLTHDSMISVRRVIQ